MENNLPPQLNLQQLKGAIDQLKAGGLSTVQVQEFVNHYDRDPNGNFVLKQTSTTAAAKPKGFLTKFMEDNAAAVDKRTKAANEAIAGTSEESKGEPAVVRGTQAAAQAAGGVVDIAGNLLKAIFGTKQAFSDNHDNKPEFNKTEQAPGTTTSIADKIGFKPEPTPKFVEAINKFTEAHPEAAKTLDSILKTLGATGEIAGTIAGADLGTGAVEKTIPEVVAPTIAKDVVESKVNDIKSAFVDDLITPKLSTKATETAIKTGKVTEGEGLFGKRDYSEAIPNYDNIKASVETVPGIAKDKTLLQNANAIHDEIGVQAEALKTALKDKGFFSPNEFNGYMSKIKTDLAENPLIVGDAEKVADKILNKFNSLVEKNGYTPEGLLQARKDLDYWMAAQKGSKVFDPATDNAITIALRSIRQGGNKFLAERVPDVEVLKMLENQSNLYQAIENIAPKAAKEGESAWQRFVVNNPNKVKALKYGATAVGGGLVANEILK